MQLQIKSTFTYMLIVTWKFIKLLLPFSTIDIRKSYAYPNEKISNQNCQNNILQNRWGVFINNLYDFVKQNFMNNNNCTIIKSARQQ